MNSFFPRRRLPKILRCVLSLALVSGSLPVLAQFTFGRIGDGTQPNRATSVSGDGSVVVGCSLPSGSVGTAFYWTAATGLVSIGDLPGANLQSLAYGVSADGQVIVGWGSSTIGVVAFRWTPSAGFLNLGDLPGGTIRSEGRAASANGSVVVGAGQSPLGRQAFRWSPSTDMVPMGEIPGGGYGSIATGVSAEGAVVVGSSTGPNGEEAFRWTQNTGLVSLGVPNFLSYSEATACSPTGEMIAVRAGANLSDSRAYYWTKAEGLTSLTNDNHGATPTGVSGNETTCGTQNSRAFIWSRSLGFVDLKKFLFDRGVRSHNQWTLNEATAISADGLTIVGNGTGPLGFSEAYRCHLDQDGTVFPTKATILTGYPIYGDLSSFPFSDSNRFGAWAEEYSSTCVVELEAVSPTATCSQLNFQCETLVERFGIAETIQLYNYQTNRFEAISGRLAKGFNFSFSYTSSSNVTRFIGPSQQLKVRFRWNPVNDESPAMDSWNHSLDVVRWKVTP